MNTIALLGTLAADVDLRYTQSGNAIGKFSVAYNKKYKTQSGEMEEKVSFFDCVAFGRRAEIINQYFKKGSRILLQGELEQQRWAAKDGSSRSKVVINVLGFDFIDRKQGQAQQQYQQQEPTYQQPPSNHGTGQYNEDVPF
jgi:single-strand DNA-binding protein